MCTDSVKTPHGLIKNKKYDLKIMRIYSQKILSSQLVKTFLRIIRLNFNFDVDCTLLNYNFKYFLDLHDILSSI